MPNVDKPELQKSEFWLVLVAALGSVASALLANKPEAQPWVTFVVTVAGVAGYAIMRTGFISERSGWKTPAFWASAAVVLASIATAISEAQVPGMPPQATKIAAAMVAFLAALGYTALRVSGKRASAKRITS